MTKYYRKGKVIRSADRDQESDSLNKAKRKSRELQQEEGGLGQGSLRVVEKLPEIDSLKDAA